MAKVLSVGSIQLSLQKSNPPSLLIEVSGTVGTPGWRNIQLVPLEANLSVDGIYDLEFAGDPPEGMMIQVTRPVTADFVMTKDVERVVGVMVHARTNSLSQLLGSPTVIGEGITSALAPAGQLGFRPADLGDLTTLAVGEETAPLGEKIPFETHPVLEKLPLMETMAVGESGPVALESSPATDIDRLVVQNQSFPGESIDDRWGMQRSPFGRR